MDTASGSPSTRTTSVGAESTRLTSQAWIAFGVMTSVGLIDAFIVFLRCDPIWAAGSIYVFLSIILKVTSPLKVCL